MRTSAAVAVTPRHIIAEQTPSRIRNAHCPVNKRLKFEFGVRSLSYLGYFGKRHFTRQNHSLCAHIIPHIGTFVIHVICLGTYMYIKFGRNLFCHPKHTQIRQNNRVQAYVANLCQKLCIFVYIIVMRNNIRRQIHFFIELFGKIDSLFYFIVCKVVRRHSERKLFTAYINRVRSVLKGNFQLFEIACRREKLGRRYCFIGFHIDFVLLIQCFLCRKYRQLLHCRY